MTSIGLCMIVKNEAHVIERCLRSVRPLIDYVLIQDTGSTDGTQATIRAYLAREGLPGEVYDEPWQNFATNRSLGLARLRQNPAVDYALVMDADDVLVRDAGFDPRAFKASLDRDCYNIEMRRGDSHYTRPQIFRNSWPFRYKGVLHEYVELGDRSTGDAVGLHILSTTDGARGRNPRKYLDDASVLERALATETDPFLRSRYTYYLGQSYRDAGALEQALPQFLARSVLGYWIDEIYVSLLGAARIMHALGRPLDDVLAMFERATQACPWRAEALHGAAQLCSQNSRHAQAYEIARRGLALAPPQGGLFVEVWIYEYGMRDEFAVAAFWAGAHRESLDACLKVLESGKLPAAELSRVAANARFAFDKLPLPDTLGTLGTESLIDQFTLQPERQLHTRIDAPPRVLVAILAKQMAASLPLHLQCLEALDYPKQAITLYVRTNNNTDDTEQLLRAWVSQVGHRYAGVLFDATDVTEKVREFGAHEWNAERFAVMGRLRNACLQTTLEQGCDFLFVADVDNFIRPSTLRNLVSAGLPIVAPLLRSIEPHEDYANCFAETDVNGYFAYSNQYDWIVQRRVRGLIEMPVVHCTYLVRADVIPELSYLDDSGRHEFVVFCDSARRAGIPQYIDNREVYGYLGRTGADAEVVRARELLQMR
jgi:tetratricopeptide (TPR) repeat protein